MFKICHFSCRLSDFNIGTLSILIELCFNIYNLDLQIDFYSKTRNYRNVYKPLYETLPTFLNINIMYVC